MRRAVVTGLFIASFFLFFTWRGITMYYTGDDMGNLYDAWSRPLGTLIRANIFFWSPDRRPFVGALYRSVFAAFGFNPLPLYILFYGILLLNLYIAYVVMRRITGSAEIGALGILLFAVHGSFDYLYYNAGSLYDACCFLFFFLALLIYLVVRQRVEYPARWSLVGFLIAYICCLNSKEMGISFPLIVLLYALFFDTPQRFQLSRLWQWLIREGRAALLAGACVLAYLPAKLGPESAAIWPEYRPLFTWARALENTEAYLGYLTYHKTPFTPLAVLGIYALLVTAACLLRSRLMWFGLLFFQVTALPVLFIPARGGYVLYLPLFGLALYVSVFLVRLKEAVLNILASAVQVRGSLATTVLFVSTASGLAWAHAVHWPASIPQSKYSPFRITKEQLLAMYPHMKRGAKLLFAHSPWKGSDELVFAVRLLYLDKDITIIQLEESKERRFPGDLHWHYDHVFTYEEDRYVELDNTDAERSVRLHILKNVEAGESLVIGSRDESTYFVNGILVDPGMSDKYWTLDAPELKFRLSSSKDRVFMARFYLSGDTLKQTGPLIIEYRINDRLLATVRYPDAGEQMFRRAVPDGWLSTNDFTLVKLRILNPYIAPADGVKLGVLLAAAGFGR